MLSGCGHNPNRAGCSFVDGTGKGQYGLPILTGVKAEGKVKGAHVYIGNDIKKGIVITCNAKKQEVKYKNQAVSEN